jgi:hypothetical protein
MPLGIHVRFRRVPFEAHDAAGNTRSTRPKDQFRQSFTTCSLSTSPSVKYRI